MQPTHVTDKEGPARHNGWRSALTTIVILIMAPLVAVLLTSFVFQSYEVDGPSMESTLQNRDRLIVWKVPRTWSRITGNGFIPSRGEVVVFAGHLDDASDQSGKQLIKRVIALPGERITISDGKITVYNKQNPDGFNPDLKGGYGPLRIETNGELDITVRKGHVFVAGDNRANSLDSRVFGTVPVEDIAGTLALRIFPFNKLKTF